MCGVNGRRTCPPVSDDKEERVIGHDLRVQHQGPGQSDHSLEQRKDTEGEMESESKVLRAKQTFER